MPEDFEEIVEIVTEEQKQRQEEDEVLDESGKPFWMRYFRADYLGDAEEKLKKGGQKGAGNEMQAKINRELDKIKKFDKMLS